MERPLDNLSALIHAGESETVEFKESWDDDSALKSLAAFANTRGGTLLIGVDDAGRAVGWMRGNKDLQNLATKIVTALNVHPTAMREEAVDHALVLVIEMPYAPPVSYKRRYYWRVGNTTREVPPDQLGQFLVESKGGTWDTLIGARNSSLEEIDSETVNRFVRRAVAEGRFSRESLDDMPEMTLERLGLVAEGTLRNGALLLFGKDPQKHFINLLVRVQRFKTDIDIIDDKWVSGNLFQQYDETLIILKQYISVRYITREIEREDVWEYPIRALGEALINALTHRDYFKAERFILIKVFDDHIWMFSPGGLPEGITIDDLKKPHAPHARNPLIAKVFYRAGYVEESGTGTTRMIQQMKDAELPEPEFKEEMGGFSVYLYKDIYTEEILRKMGLNERQITAVLYVKERGQITNEEYQEIAHISKPTATRELSTLVKMDLLLRRGITGRGTSYVLKKGSQRDQRVHKGLTKGSNNGND